MGHLPYNPAPFNAGPQGPNAAAAPEAPVNAHIPPADEDFVEIIGGVHPINGPWVVDHDFVEIIGGVHPILGPWVEGAPPVNDPEVQPNQELNLDGLLGDLPDPPIDFDFDLDLLQW